MITILEGNFEGTLFDEEGEKHVAHKYISAQDAANMMEYALVTVEQMCRQGRLEGELIGNRWFVMERSVDEWLEKKQAKATR